MWKTLALVVIALGLGACSSPTGIKQGTPRDLGAIQCSWSASLNDAGATGCRAYRTYVQCDDAAGNTCDCSSDGTLGCDCIVGDWMCDYACAANEYAVSCGSVNPGAGSPQAAPPGCRTVASFGSAVVISCCPCG
jgi:hypothetical protein